VPSLRGAAEGAYTTTSANGQIQLRVLAEPVGHTGKLVVTTSLASLDSTASRLQLIVSSLAAAVVVVIGVGFVVRRGLRPVEVMATVADKITAGDLTSRVLPDDPATEVGRLGAALSGMLTRIEAAVREREASEEATRRFFADASHELRTPLASLRANAELYRQGALTRPVGSSASTTGGRPAILPGVTAVQYTGSVSNVNAYRSPYIPPIDTDALSVDASSTGLPAVVGTSVAQGTYLNAATEHEPVAVLGYQAAQRLGSTGSGQGRKSRSAGCGSTWPAY